MDECHAAEYGRARAWLMREQEDIPISNLSFLFSACSHLICYLKKKKRERNSQLVHADFSNNSDASLDIKMHKRTNDPPSPPVGST